MANNLDEQLAMNQETWASLWAHGVKTGSNLGVDAFLVANSEADADGLARALPESGWECLVVPNRVGLTRRKVWDVRASKEIVDVSLPRINEMVTECVAVADQHSSEFDGWGAVLPEDR